MKAEVQSSVRAAKRKVLQRTVEKNLNEILLDSYEVEKERVRKYSNQFTRCVLTHLVTPATLLLGPGNQLRQVVAVRRVHACNHQYSPVYRTDNDMCDGTQDGTSRKLNAFKISRPLQADNPPLSSS